MCRWLLVTEPLMMYLLNLFPCAQRSTFVEIVAWCGRDGGRRRRVELL